MKWLDRRQRLLIDNLQIKLLSINLMYTSAMVLVFVGVIFGPLIVTTLDPSASAEQKLDAADRLLLLHKTIWFAVLVVAILFSFHSVLYTHRIAGPLYRFRRVLRTVGGGDLSPRAGVRAKDYLKAESDVINEMIDGLRLRVGGVRDAYEQLRVTAFDPGEQAPAESGEKSDLEIRLLRARIEELGSALDAFRLPDLVATQPTEPATPSAEAAPEVVHP